MMVHIFDTNVAVTAVFVFILTFVVEVTFLTNVNCPLVLWFFHHEVGIKVSSEDFFGNAWICKECVKEGTESNQYQYNINDDRYPGLITLNQFITGCYV